MVAPASDPTPESDPSNADSESAEMSSETAQQLNDAQVQQGGELSNLLERVFSGPMKVTGAVQDYAWGKGEDSLVHQFSGETTENGKYAELWFGAHANGQSTIHDGGSIQNGSELPPLLQLVDQFPEQLLGEQVVAEYGKQMPFLFKILSVGDSLSIQAHPDKDFAPVLHARDSKNYPDTNPKPEVGIALSPVQLLYGFRPVDEIREFLSEGEKFVPELAEIVGEEIVDQIRTHQLDGDDLINAVYRRVMAECPEATLQKASNDLFKRVKNSSSPSPEEAWISKMEGKYPDNPSGPFNFYMLNLVTVPEGRALYIGPNIAHAYLDNELAECMAPSDNVVRAGLTPKFIDVDTLIEMIDYSPQPPQMLDPVSSDIPGYAEYPVPLDRFFSIGVVSGNEEGRTIPTENSIELFVVVEGAAKISAGEGDVTLKPGEAAFIPGALSEYSVKMESGKAFRVRVPW